jgi:small-conductance mechanosensitive channel/CRP-like cAMP-binding protein
VNSLVWLGYPLLAFVVLELAYLSLRRFRGVRRHTLSVQASILLLTALLMVKLARTTNAVPTDSWLVAANVDHWLLGALAVVAAYLILKLLEAAIIKGMAARRPDVSIPRLFPDIIRLVVLVGVVLVVLRLAFGVNLSPLVATSAVLSAVIGLALQATLANIASGIALQIARPFKAGDWVQIGDKFGSVTETNWREIRIRTLDNDHVILPNSRVAEQEIINFHLPSRVHAKSVFVGASYGALPGEVKEACTQAALDSPEVLRTPRPVIRLDEFGDSAVMYEVRFWIKDYSRHMDIAEQVRTNIWYQFDRRGIEIPLPQRIVTASMVSQKLLETKRQSALGELETDLSNVPFLKPLSTAEIQALAKLARTEHYGPGEALVRQGDEGDSFFIMRQGTVAVELAAPDRQSTTVAQLGPGDFFGEMSLLTGESRSATVRSKADSEVVIIDKGAFATLLRSNESIATTLSTYLEERARRNAEQLAKLKGPDAAPLEVESSHSFLRKIRRFFALD